MVVAVSAGSWMQPGLDAHAIYLSRLICVVRGCLSVGGQWRLGPLGIHGSTREARPRRPGSLDARKTPHESIQDHGALAPAKTAEGTKALPEGRQLAQQVARQPLPPLRL